MKDYRYIAPDGSTVEAWQLTETSRYQDKEWPAWLQSRWFMTVDNATWLDVDGEEMKLPELSWVVWEDGHVAVVDPYKFEEYQKMVPEELITTEPNEVVMPPEAQNATLDELKELWAVGETLGAEGVYAALKEAISRHTVWCSCPPGQCRLEPDADRWGCRSNSPLL